MNTVTSKDGTRIAFDQAGQGAPVILIDGAFGYRGAFGQDPLAKLLAPRFSVISYDRRGRGDSTDTSPYAIQREVEDVEALIGCCGGSAALYGISSGAGLALYAAGRLPGVTRLALYEPPLILDDSRARIPADYLDILQRMLAEGRRGDMVKYFMTAAVGAPWIFTLIAPLLPVWPKLKAVAHTVIYDSIIMGDNTLAGGLGDAAGSVRARALVMGGGKSPQWMRHAVQATAEAIPGAQIRLLDGQTHEVDPKVIAPVLAEFFGG